MQITSTLPPILLARVTEDSSRTPVFPYPGAGVCIRHRSKDKDDVINHTQQLGWTMGKNDRQISKVKWRSGRFGTSEVCQ